MQKANSYYSEKLRFLIFRAYKEKTEGFIDFNAIDNSENAKKMKDFYKDREVPIATLERFLGTKQDGVKITLKVLNSLTQLLEKYKGKENAWQEFIRDHQTLHHSTVLEFAPVPHHAHFLQKHFPEWYFPAHKQIKAELGLGTSPIIDYKNEIVKTYNTFQGATFEQQVQMANGKSIRIFDYFFYYDHVSKLIAALKRGEKVELLLCNPFSEIGLNRQIKTKERVISSLERIIKIPTEKELETLDIKLFNQSPSYFLYQVGDYMHMGFSYIYLGNYESAFNFCMDIKPNTEMYKNIKEHFDAFWQHNTTITLNLKNTKNLEKLRKSGDFGNALRGVITPDMEIISKNYSTPKMGR